MNTLVELKEIKAKVSFIELRKASGQVINVIC